MMYLIRISDKTLCQFHEQELPKYAILSHRWLPNGDEPDMQQFRSGEAKSSKGYLKISKCCELARKANLRYAWIDTVCIDKKNNTELTEAINSMYRWYQRSELCIVFLPDVSGNGRMATSEWFKRGWTLQELLAPRRMMFYDQDFSYLGTKEELKDQIFAATGIADRNSDFDGTSLPSLLGDKTFAIITSACVAERMSWVSRRETTVPEDLVYCMLGIFNVNMPLLYGEGRKKAFVRLQEQIIAQTDDETIFAWNPDPDEPRCAGDEPRARGILAEDPKEFSEGRDVLGVKPLTPRPAYSLTNKGLSFSVHCRINPNLLPYVDVKLFAHRWENPHTRDSNDFYRRPVGDQNLRPIVLRFHRTSWRQQSIWYRSASSRIKTMSTGWLQSVETYATGCKPILVAKLGESLDGFTTVRGSDTEDSIMKRSRSIRGAFVYGLTRYIAYVITIFFFAALASLDSGWPTVSLLFGGWGFLTMGWTHFGMRSWFPLTVAFLGLAFVSPDDGQWWSVLIIWSAWFGWLTMLLSFIFNEKLSGQS